MLVNNYAFNISIKLSQPKGRIFKIPMDGTCTIVRLFSQSYLYETKNCNYLSLLMFAFRILKL